MDQKLKMSQPDALAALKANGAVGCLSKSEASKPKDMVIIFSSALIRPHLKYSVQSLSSWLRRDI